ncbi:MAG: phosphoribosylformylglycinamidine synthase I [Bacteriovoracaceae bacterium]|nr:phosphoribosylformylglycinamidine synthase I [Bacteriovoracaceae bacterium]
MIRVVVICGDGLNCERESARAFELVGAKVDIIHINQLKSLKNYQVLVIPGGFSFGDEISSGQVLALKLKYQLADELKNFVESGKLVLGICNGFQALVKLGLLPKPFEPRTMTLTNNTQKQFLNRWVDLEIGAKSPCIFTKDMATLKLPIRHGEGKIVFKGDESQQKKYYEELKKNHQIVFTYTEDVNGSYQKIAGVCDPTGHILGLMPHPEAAINQLLMPYGEKKNTAGPALKIFENAVSYFQ